MVTKRIARPSEYVAKGDLDHQIIWPRNMIRVSSHKSKEPFFGKSGTNRFDAPDNNLFGTCYLGKTLEVAIAESILHDACPKNGEFKVAPEVFSSRFVIRFSGSKLRFFGLFCGYVIRCRAVSAITSMRRLGCNPSIATVDAGIASQPTPLQAIGSFTHRKV